MSGVIPFNQLHVDDIGRDGSVIFGGTFDPIHSGHMTVINRLRTLFPRVIIAPTGQNPWKEDTVTPYAMRIQMIILMLEAERITYSEKLTDRGVVLYDSPYTYSVELLQEVRKKLSPPLWWAVGSDSAEGVTRWKEWDKKGVPVVSLPITLDVHATAIRTGVAQLHPALTSFASLNKLYRKS